MILWKTIQQLDGLNVLWGVHHIPMLVGPWHAEFGFWQKEKIERTELIFTERLQTLTSGGSHVY